MKRHLFRSLKENNRGAAIVEFAIVIPILMILVMGMIEFGWILNGWITLTASAREGARVAAVIRDDELVRNAVQKHVDGTPLINVTIPDPERTAEDVSVTVNGQIQPLVGFFANGLVDLSGKAVMRREY